MPFSAKPSQLDFPRVFLRAIYGSGKKALRRHAPANPEIRAAGGLRKGEKRSGALNHLKTNSVGSKSFLTNFFPPAETLKFLPQDPDPDSTLLSEGTPPRIHSVGTLLHAIYSCPPKIACDFRGTGGTKIRFLPNSNRPPRESHEWIRGGVPSQNLGGIVVKKDLGFVFSPSGN